MKTLITLLIFCLLLSVSLTTTAQDFGVGSNAENGGAKSWNPFPKRQLEMPKFKLPSFDLFKKKPTTPLGSAPMDYTDNQSRGFPRLFQRPTNGEPGLFESFNTKSAEFWGRTTNGFSNWARETNAKMKARSYETWDNITRGFPKGLPSLPKPQTPKIKLPPFRAASNPTEKPKVRF